MSKTSISIIVLIVAVLAAGATALSLTMGRVKQPIAFNHRLHVQDVGLECTDCHLYAKSGVRATIPNVEMCAGCHEEKAGESEAEAQLLEHVQSETLIPWRKVYWVPDDVYFSHRRHATLGQIGCEVCHGAVGEEEEPVTAPFVQVTMDGCMQCHYETNTSNDCLGCHR